MKTFLDLDDWQHAAKAWDGNTLTFHEPEIIDGPSRALVRCATCGLAIRLVFGLVPGHDGCAGSYLPPVDHGNG